MSENRSALGHEMVARWPGAISGMWALLVYFSVEIKGLAEFVNQLEEVG